MPGSTAATSSQEPDRGGRASIRSVPGVVAVVVIGDFVGVVAEREEQAVQAARQLRVTWHESVDLPNLNRPETALRANPSTPRVLLDKGGRGGRDRRRGHADEADLSVAVPDACRDRPVLLGRGLPAGRADRLVRHAETRTCYARIWPACLDLPEDRIEIIRHEGRRLLWPQLRRRRGGRRRPAVARRRPAGAGAALARTEHAWEPKGAAQVIDVDGGLDAAGHVVGYDFATCYPSNLAPNLALLLTGTIPPVAQVAEMGDRTAIPPYSFDAMRITCTTWRRSSAPRGSAACRRCRTASRMNPGSTNARPRPGSTRSNTACAPTGPTRHRPRSRRRGAGEMDAAHRPRLPRRRG